MPVTTGDPTTPKIVRARELPAELAARTARASPSSTTTAARTTLQVADLTSRRAGAAHGPRPDRSAGRRAPLRRQPRPRLPPLAGWQADRLFGASTAPPACRASTCAVFEKAEARPLSPGDRAESYPGLVARRPMDRHARCGRDARRAGGRAPGGREDRCRSSPRERGEAWIHHWTGDGKRIVFAGQRAGVWNVWSVSRETGQETQVTRYTGVNTFVRYPVRLPARRSHRVRAGRGARQHLAGSTVPAAGDRAGTGPSPAARD